MLFLPYEALLIRLNKLIDSPDFVKILFWLYPLIYHRVNHDVKVRNVSHETLIIWKFMIHYNISRKMDNYSRTKSRSGSELFKHGIKQAGKPACLITG